MNKKPSTKQQTKENNTTTEETNTKKQQKKRSQNFDENHYGCQIDVFLDIKWMFLLKLQNTKKVAVIRLVERKHT
jgi:hypothetical protein